MSDIDIERAKAFLIEMARGNCPQFKIQEFLEASGVEWRKPRDPNEKSFDQIVEEIRAANVFPVTKERCVNCGIAAVYEDEGKLPCGCCYCYICVGRGRHKGHDKDCTGLEPLK